MEKTTTKTHKPTRRPTVHLRKQREALPPMEKAMDDMGTSNIDAVLYDGKRIAHRCKLLSGAITVVHNGMVFARVEHRDVMGRKNATVRRDAIKFKRLSLEKEANELAYRRGLKTQQAY